MDVNKNELLSKTDVKGLVSLSLNEIKRYKVSKNDFLIARTSETLEEIAFTSCLKEDIENCVYSGFLLKASPKEDNLNSLYFTYLFRSSIYRKKLMRISTITSRALINTANLEHLKMFFPEISEQKKIIDFLTILNNKIKVINNKIEVLKKYKEGLINNLLKPTVVNWKNNMKEGSKLSNFLVPYKQMALNNNVYNHATLSKEGVVPKCERYDRDFLVKDSNKQYRVTHLNDLIYNPANLKFGVICINKLGTVIVSPIYETFKIINIDQILLEAFLTSNTFINFSLKFEEGTVYERKAVSVEDFLNIKICVKNINSQKISLILKAIQTKNNILSDKLKVIKSLKSYLLSYMFI